MDDCGTNDFFLFFHLVNNELQHWISAYQENDETQLRRSINILTHYSTILCRVKPIVSEHVPEAINLFDNLAAMTDQVLAHSPISQSNSNVENKADFITVVRNGESGRPSISVSLDLVNALKHSGVSRGTLYKMKWKITDLLPLSDEDLRRELMNLKHENRNVGEVYAIAHLRALGYSVTRARVRNHLRSMDPIGMMHRRRVKVTRRIYEVESPNDVWHMDGNEKLQPYGIYIHGSIDGYSRKIIYLQCASNKKALNVLNYFEAATSTFGYPHKVRSDYGGENIEVARHMLRKFGLGRGKFITGKSVHNIRIERLWVEVNKVTQRYRTLFSLLQSEGHYDFCSSLDRFCLYYIFLPRIQRSLNSFVLMWDSHKIRTAGRKTPNELYLTGHRRPPPLITHNVNDYEGAPQEMDESRNHQFFNSALEVLPDPSEEDGNEGVTLYHQLKNYLLLMTRE